eukprot:Ihof_evm1s372 gene=Ihof_evmTU1s372
MKTISFIAVAIALLSAVEGRTMLKQALYQYETLTFSEWATLHGKVYSSGLERMLRESIWKNNVMKIMEHNNANAFTQTYWLDVNHLADLTQDEYKKGLLRSSKNPRNRGSLFSHATTAERLPRSIDWRDRNIVTRVKNQGQCGSCYAFAATGSLEGQYAKSTGKLVSLSEQQLVDCSIDYGNKGCGGGLMDDAFRYLEQHGIEREDDYEYEAVERECRYNQSQTVIKVKGFVDIPFGDEQSLMHAIGKIGPVAVAIDASHFSFQFYAGGVYNERMCSQFQLDHGVLAVGYGTESGHEFYWVKN